MNIADLQQLSHEIAGPTLTGVRRPWSAHAGRLTPGRLGALLREAGEGDAAAYLELAEEMEEKDLHYRSVIATRKMQVAGLPLVVEAASEAEEDVAAADLVRDFTRTGVLQSALPDMLDAVGKGFSVCELLWDTAGPVWRPGSIVWRDPRWFAFDRADGTTLRLRGEGGREEPLAPGKFVIHTHKSKSGLPIRGGLARAASWYYLFKSFDVSGWVRFAEAYGFPLRLGKYDAQATEEDKRTLLKAVRGVTRDMAAIFPQGMEIEFVQTQASGSVTLFEGLAAYVDSQISKLVLGQTGTTDAGQHVGTADAHERVRADIARSDAEQLSATLNRDLVRPLVDLNLGPRARYPRLALSAEKTGDVAALVDNVVKLAPLAPGLVEVSVLRDRLGLPEPEKGAEVVGGGK